MITTSPITFGSDRGKTLEKSSYAFIDRYINNMDADQKPRPGLLGEDIDTFTRHTDAKHLDQEDQKIVGNLVQKLKLLGSLCFARKERSEAEAFTRMHRQLQGK